jgi:hypothetical protein
MSVRRTLLKAGGGALLAAGGALAWRAWDQGVFSTGRGPAYDAWDQWNHGPAGSPQRLVRAAILAANPHNSQPWRFRAQADRVDLYADRARHLGAIDPYLREMYIGLGCALENLLLAAPAAELVPTLALLPTAGDTAHVAQVTLAPGRTAASPLYAAIAQRHTNRGAYDLQRPIEASALAALEALGSDLPQVAVRWFTGAAQRRDIGARIVEASAAITADAEQSRDSGAWFRNSWDELQRKRDGLTIDAQAFPGWLRFAAKVLPPVGTEQADRLWLEATRDVHVATAPAFGLLLARDPRDPLQCVNGGRLWQRMHLWAQTRGIAMHPLNQLAERADREHSTGAAPRFQGVLQALAGDGAWRALMPFRLGHPMVTALRSPRRPIEEVLMG